MTTPIKALSTVDPDVVDALRESLARAERGDLTGVALLGWGPNRQHHFFYAGQATHLEKIGAASLLAHALAASMEEDT